jgi:hypothetical protein
MNPSTHAVLARSDVRMDPNRRSRSCELALALEEGTLERDVFILDELRILGYHSHCTLLTYCASKPLTQGASVVPSTSLCIHAMYQPLRDKGIASKEGLLSPAGSSTSTACSKPLSEPAKDCEEGNGYAQVKCSKSHASIQTFDQLSGRTSEP